MLVARGFGHGTVYLWAPDGTLMATASQSAIVRATAGPSPSSVSESHDQEEQPADEPALTA